MERKIYYFICLTIALMIPFASLHAQVHVGDEDVDVVSGYNPALADAVKEEITPQLPENNSKPEQLDYNLPIEFYQIPYQPVKVKPIRMPDPKPTDLDNVFVKAGFGTQLTPLAEAYVSSNRNKNYNYGFFGKYISSNGNIDYQNYSDLRLGGNANFYFDDKYTLPVNAYFSRSELYYYGYNHDDTTFTKDDIQQRFSNYGMSAGFHNIGENPLNMDFGVKAGFSGIMDINGYKEINPFANAFAEKKLENKSIVGAELSLDYYKYTGATENENTLIGVKPYFKMIRDNWSINAAVKTIVDDANKAFILPDAVFSYDLVGDKLVFVAGWQAHLQKNNFENIVAENPFVADSILFVNSAIDEISGGLRGSTNGNFSFTIKGYEKFVDDLPVYINDSSDMKRFIVAYTDATMFGGNLELSYFNTNHFRFTGSLDAFSFSDIKKFDHAYHRPTISWTLSGMYAFNKKLNMTLDVFGVGKSYALLPDETEVTIDGAVDLNLSATYIYSKYFNIFVNLNNMASFKYQRYYNYPSYGIQALAGISFAF